MPVPTHGPLCQTRIYPTACWSCQHEIFVLQCTCGSAVLLDDRWPPWPKHTCASTGGTGGIGGSGLSGWAAVETLRAQGVPITSDIIQEVFPGERPSGHKPSSETATNRIEPGDGTQRSVLGCVHTKGVPCAMVAGWRLAKPNTSASPTVCQSSGATSASPTGRS